MISDTNNTIHGQYILPIPLPPPSRCACAATVSWGGWNEGLLVRTVVWSHHAMHFEWYWFGVASSEPKFESFSRSCGRVSSSYMINHYQSLWRIAMVEYYSTISTSIEADDHIMGSKWLVNRQFWSGLGLIDFRSRHRLVPSRYLAALRFWSAAKRTTAAQGLSKRSGESLRSGHRFAKCDVALPGFPSQRCAIAGCRGWPR